jgi:hypothetical protein
MVAARPNTVRLRHAGKTSTLLHLGSATATDLEALTLALALIPTPTPTPTPYSQGNLNQAAFSTLRDATYSEITVTEAEQGVERAVLVAPQLAAPVAWRPAATLIPKGP